jgi:putative endonuclease
VFTTYVLRSSKTGRFYTGSTSDFAARLQQHNSGTTISTKNRGHWELVYKEQFETRAEAVTRERYFKRGAGRDEVKRILIQMCGTRLGGPSQHQVGSSPPRRVSGRTRELTHLESRSASLFARNSSITD